MLEQQYSTMMNQEMMSIITLSDNIPIVAEFEKMRLQEQMNMPASQNYF